MFAFAPYGTVQSTTPLTISIDQKLILSEKFLIIPESLTDYETEISFDDPSVKQVFTTWNMEETAESTPSKISFKEKIKHKITVYNSLKVGKKLYFYVSKVDKNIWFWIGR